MRAGEALENTKVEAEEPRRVRRTGARRKGLIPDKEEKKMSAVKERMREVIESQPDDASYEEIMREVALALMVDRGLEDSRKGRVISNEEMEHRIRTWQE